MKKLYKAIYSASAIILCANFSFGQESYSILDVKLGDSIDNGKSRIAGEFKNMVCKDYNIDKSGFNIGTLCVNEKDSLQSIDRISNYVVFGNDKNKKIISIKRKISFEDNKYPSFEITEKELINKYGKTQFEYLSKSYTGKINYKTYLWRKDRKDILPSSDNESKSFDNKYRDYANRYSLPSAIGYITNELYNNRKKPLNDEMIGTFLYCHMAPYYGNDKLVRHIECILTDQNEVINSNNYYVNTIIDNKNSSIDKEVEQSKSIKTKF